MIIVGERINSSRAPIARALEAKDAAFIQREAALQVAAGADYVDVNAGALAKDEAAYLEWLVAVVQEAVDKPLCIDTPDPRAMAPALKRHRGKALVNSITAERERYQTVLPLVKGYRCGVIALCLSEAGMPGTTDEGVAIASRLIDALTSEGVPLGDIYIDPLVRPISVSYKAASVALETISQVMARYPGVHTICGLSNVSFGLPGRRLLNRAFAVLARQQGLDAAILDPCDRELMACLVAAEAMLGGDDYCMNYIRAYRTGKLGK